MIWLPLKTTTPGNRRRHWRVEAKEAKEQRMAAYLGVLSCRPLPRFPVKVTLTRVGRRMDRHNLPGALKHIIDGIADAYRVDDGDERWQFEFAQESGKHPGVRVVIEAK